MTSCGTCGAHLSHINAVCDICLPDFYNPPGQYVTYQSRPPDLEVLVNVGSQIFLNVLDQNGHEYEIDIGPTGGTIVHIREYFNLSVAMRNVARALLSEIVGSK